MRTARHHRSVLCIGASLVIASCAESGTPSTDASSSTDQVTVTNPVDSAAPVAVATTEAEPAGRPEPVGIGDLSAAPFITFAPIGPRPESLPDSPFPDGSDDYWDLFVDGAPWSEALAQVDAVKIHSWQAREHFGDLEIINMIDFLARHEIPLVVEMEPLQPPDPAECDHTESFEGPLEILTARKIKRLGGVIAAVAIEQPYSFAHKLTGDGACEYSVERITDELVLWVAELRDIFPDVVVGSIEGIWTSPATTPDDMAIWLDAYEAALGEPLAFLQMDVNWSRPDWVEVARGIEDVAEARGVPFGLLINGGLAESNDEWLQFAAERMADFESTGGGTPTQVTFQSWVDQPDRVLPEDDPGAFTHLLNRYVGVRTFFTDVAIDATTVSGTLIDADGAAVASQIIEAGRRGLFGEPNVIEFTGRVPADANAALIVVRVNAEDAAPGAVDGHVYSISYTEPDGSERVLNGDFARGDAGWGTDPGMAGSARFAPGDDGRPALRLQAGVDEPIYVNSESFTVTPGTEFTLRVEAAVTDTGDVAPSGQVAVAFLDGDRELGRRGVDLVPPFGELVPTVTDADGRFAIHLGGLDPTGAQFLLSTPGDVSTWPGSVVVTTPG